MIHTYSNILVYCHEKNWTQVKIGPELPGSEMIQFTDCKDRLHIGFCITVDKKAESSKWHCISCSQIVDRYSKYHAQ